MLKIFTKTEGKGAMSKKEDSSIKAYLGENVVFKGGLSFDGTVRIDGKFEGHVNTNDTLIIGETGDVVAEIVAGTVICKGRLKGTIVAATRVEMHASSKVFGDVKSPSLTMESGAVLDGNCDMSGNEERNVIQLVKEDGSKSNSIPS
jgi:cytoskeletal protein CcmA (bactofilin family)